MLSIAIKEENSHFEHGLKIIISHLSNQWHQEICFLPVEIIDRADIAFISLDEDWLSADCYQIPIHTRRQHRVVICNKNVRCATTCLQLSAITALPATFLSTNASS